MNSDKELVEVWQKQFEDWAYDYPGDALSKKYLEQAWIASKRSQPSVVLPRLINFNDASVSGKERVIYNNLLLSLANQFETAGIKYTIGE